MSNKLHATLLAAIGVCFATSASASIVTYDLTINGSSTPAAVTVGDIVTVGVYVRVTENNFIYNSIARDLGLSLYWVDLDGGTNLKPVEGLDPGLWDAAEGAAMGIFDPGTISGNKVISLGGGTSAPLLSKSTVGVSRTLLAEGTFEAISAGTITMGASTLLSNVFTVNSEGLLRYAEAGAIGWQPVPSLIVMPVPEPSTVMLAAGVVISSLSVRKRCRDRVA